MSIAKAMIAEQERRAQEITERIKYLNKIAADALKKANRFFNSLNHSFRIWPVFPNRVNPILIDPTMRRLTPPVQPIYPSPLRERPPQVYTPPHRFTDILASPPIFRGPERFDFNEDKVTWLSNETRTAIRRLFNETGYEAVEIDLWEKGNERDLQALRDSEDVIISSMATRGFTMPNDIIDIALNDLNNRYDDTGLLKSSDIALRQMDIAQKNVQTGIGFGLDGEQLLMGYSLRIAGRALDAAKAMAGLGLEIFRVKTLGYNAELKARREVMQGAVEIESSLLDAYKERATIVESQLNAYVASISTLLRGYGNMLSAYKADIRARKTMAGVTMSWRKAKYRESLANIKAQLEANIIDLRSDTAVEELRKHEKAGDALYYVNYLAAALSSLQVLINQKIAEDAEMFETE